LIVSKTPEFRQKNGLSLRQGHFCIGEFIGCGSADAENSTGPAPNATCWACCFDLHGQTPHYTMTIWVDRHPNQMVKQKLIGLQELNYNIVVDHDLCLAK
jgi:hypothetical protein